MCDKVLTCNCSFAVSAIFNSKRGGREQTERENREGNGLRANRERETLNKHSFLVLTPGFFLNDPCLVLGAPALQFVALWSATAIFMRALMYFYCFLLCLLAQELDFTISDVIPMSPWKWKHTLILALISCAS